MKKRKIIFVISILLLAIPALALASNFDYVRMIRFNPSTTFTLFVPFEGSGVPDNTPTWFDLSKFTQEQSISSFKLQIVDGKYKLFFNAKNIGTLSNFPKNKVQIETKNGNNEEVTCSQFNENGIICNGAKLFLNIKRPGHRWSGETDSYKLEISGGLLGFGNAVITGYKNGADDSKVEVVKIELETNSYSFNYFATPEKKRASFRLQGGDAEWINEPTEKRIDNTYIEWNFDNFAQTSNAGWGKIRSTAGFSGSITMNLQGTLTVDGTTYPVRNEIYVNLDKKHFSDCPIFEETHILCYARSGYIHTYIPSHEDITFWKSFPKVFVFEITGDDTIGRKATLSAGENSVDDIFKISNMNVIDFKFR